MFKNQMILCNEFHLSPFQLRRERFSEYCLLIKRLNNYAEKQKNKPKTKDGKEQKFIPVMDYKGGGG